MKFAPLDTFSRLRTGSLVTRSVPVSPFWRLWMRPVLALRDPPHDGEFGINAPGLCQGACLPRPRP
jgi:hypothetical protein